MATKDFKSKDSGPVFPPKLLRPATSSPPRDDEYFFVNKTPPTDRKEGAEVSPPEGDKLLGLCQERRGIRMETSKTHSLLAGLGIDPSAAETILRDELLKERNKWSHSAANNAKRYFTIQTNTITSGTETTIPLARIAQGSSSNTRTDDIIGLHNLTLQFIISRVVTAASTVSPISPTLRWYVWRDKVPASPGTPPTTLGTDALPPASTSLIYSRLGQAAIGYNAVAVINPVTFDKYHIYQSERMPLQSREYDYPTAAPPGAVAQAHVWEKTIQIPLNGVEQTYSGPGATSPLLNDLYFTYFVDRTYTNYGYTDSMSVTSDVTFADIQL